MSKAFTDLDMNANDILAAANLIATGTVRSNTQFNRNGTNGLTKSFSITELSGAVHAFVFNGGILTGYTLTGGH